MADVLELENAEEFEDDSIARMKVIFFLNVGLWFKVLMLSFSVFRGF